MANKMTDKKKNTSRSQMAEMRVRSSEKEQPEKSVKTAARTERKESPVAENKNRATPRRRDAKGSVSWYTRLRTSKAGRFFFDAYYELRHKVTWPTFQEAGNMTVVVILLSAAIGGLLSLVDFGLYNLFLLISGGK